MSARAHERVAFDNPPTHYQRRQTAVTVNGHGRRYGAVPYLCVKGQQPPTSTPLAVDIPARRSAMSVQPQSKPDELRLIMHGNADFVKFALHHHSQFSQKYVNSAGSGIVWVSN